MNYRKIWENHHNACLIPHIHIHHIDGDRHNNKIDNLMAVTPQEHYDIHYSQGDWGDARLLALNFLSVDRHTKSELSRLTMKKTWDKMFKTMTRAEITEKYSKAMSGIKRTEKQKENYRYGAKKRCSDPTFSYRLSNACKGKRTVVTCPHCKKSGGGGNMRRYHFDKCKGSN